MMIEKELLEKVENKTFTDYEVYDVVGGNDNETYVKSDMIHSMLEDLLAEIENLEEQLEEAKQPIEEEDHYEDYTLKKAGLI